MNKTNLWSQLNTKDYLTKYAEGYSNELWDASQKCRGIQLDNKKYLVYVPYDFDERKEEKKVVPSYYRVRTVTLTESGYMNCSCGLSVRMKMPCKHIIYVVGTTDIQMYGIRWYKHYQHYFEREVAKLEQII